MVFFYTVDRILKVAEILSDFSRIWSFSTDFRSSPQFQIARKFVQWESRADICDHTDGQI